MTVFYILLAIILFGILILVHEFGHFITAKLFGVLVNEFSLFMGPAIWKKQMGETLYAVRCIPIGGYCAMEGEDGDSDNPRAFTNAQVWQRLIILVAGAFMNLVIGFLLTVIFVSIRYDGIPGTQIAGFEANCPYESAQGLQVGDQFYSIDGERVYVLNDFYLLTEDLAKDQVFDLVVIRNGEKVELPDFELKRLDYNGDLRYGFNLEYREKTVGSVLSFSWNQCVDFARMVRLSLKMLFTGDAGIKDMSGPAGIVKTVTDVGVQSATVGIGVTNVLYFFALIAVNLAVMNLLPIPALDGGRAVCLIITWVAEKILRRKIDPKYEGYLHGGFMILLLAFMAIITFKDIFQMFGG